MPEFDWERMGQGIAALGAIAVGLIAWMRGQSRSNGESPLERTPPKDEIKSALDELRVEITRLHNKLDRHGEISDDEWRDISRQLDRIEAAQRLETAMIGFRRKEE